MGRITLGVVGGLAMLTVAVPRLYAEGTKGFQARIVDGVQTSTHPEVGALVIDSRFGTSFCSGTMIGCETFVTAAHCVCSGLLSAADCTGLSRLSAAADLSVYLPSAGLFKGASVTFNNDYKFATGGDVAVIKLSKAMTGIEPARINTRAHPSPGSGGDIVGYGLDGKSSAVGLKRFGQVAIETCEGVPDDKNVCWRFDEPVDLPGEDSNTCNGDSGGPLFVNFGDGDVLAGVTSGGRVGCHPPDESFDTDVFYYRDFITTAAGADIDNARCGDVPHVGESGTTVTTKKGSLTGDVRDARFTIEVPAGVALLRVGLNGESRNAFVRNDFDLAVLRDAPASLQQFDCRDDSSLSYAFCEVANPIAGTWNILVHTSRGSGKFQLTATTFAATSSRAACNAQSDITIGELVDTVDRVLNQSSADRRASLPQSDDDVAAVEQVIRATNAAVRVCGE